MSREELVQRRVEQAHGDRLPVHRLEDADEVVALEAASSCSAACSSLIVLGEDEPLHQRQAVAEEHVLGTAQADALGAEVAGHLRVVREVGVGAHAEGPELVGPGEDRSRTDRSARA